MTDKKLNSFVIVDSSMKKRVVITVRTSSELAATLYFCRIYKLILIYTHDK